MTEEEKNYVDEVQELVNTINKQFSLRAKLLVDDTISVVTRDGNGGIICTECVEGMLADKVVKRELVSIICALSEYEQVMKDWRIHVLVNSRTGVALSRAFKTNYLDYADDGQKIVDSLNFLFDETYKKRVWVTSNEEIKFEYKIN